MLSTISDPCEKRRISWSKHPGYAITGNNTERFNKIFSVEECRQRCLSATGFMCRSFEVHIGLGVCFLSTADKVEAGDNFNRWPGYVYQEWVCATGER